MGILGNPGGAFQLIADPSSLDGELMARLLDHYLIAYHRQPRGVLLARGSAAARARPGGAALLYNDAVALAHPAEVVYHFESQMPEQQRLLPQQPQEVRELESHWKLYYHAFNEAVCAWLYAHLLPQRSALVEALTRHAGAPEKLAVQLAYPMIASRLRKRHQIGPGKAEEVLGVIRKGYDRIDRRLQDGRHFLLGERMGLADLLFAVMAAPTVLPEEFTGPNPRGAQVPPKMQQIVRELRSRPAGQLVLRLYREVFRGPVT